MHAADRRVLVFTICAKNYLPRARVCLGTVAENFPGADTRLFLSDDADQGFDTTTEAFPITCVGEVGLDFLEDAKIRYDVTEFSTAIKPACFQYAFRLGYDIVVYLDPDTRTYNSLADAITPLKTEKNMAVVTPHVTKPAHGKAGLNERRFLAVGVYNLGFLALRLSSECDDFLVWWAEVLQTGSVSEPKLGLFTDQRWCDVLPSFIPDTLVLRHPGYNLAYWNLDQRVVSWSGGSVVVDDSPLVFAHFSGFRADQPEQISVHRPELSFAQHNPFVELARQYGAEVTRETRPEERYTYSYDRLPDGRSMNTILRKVYRSSHPRPVPGARRPTLALEAALAEPEPGASPQPAPSRLLAAVLRADPTASALWEVNRAADVPAIRQWFMDEGAARHGVADWKSLEGPAQSAPAIAKGRRVSVRAWLRSAISAPLRGFSAHRVLPVSVRKAIRTRVIQVAFSNMSEASGPLSSELAPGACLIGYTKAELGMGEHVRMTAAALQAAEVPCSAIDVGARAMARQEDDRMSHLIRPVGDLRANIWHVNADEVIETWLQLGAPLTQGRVNIAYPAWELAEFPSRWVGALDGFQEIWAPSRFIQKAIAAKTDKPVVHMPLAVALAPGYEAFGRAHFGLPANDFLFLNYSDFASFAARKNPCGAIDAFCKAFPVPAAEPVRLVIKTLSAERYPEEAEQLRRRTIDRNDIIVISDTLTAAEIHGLVACCDVFVSLHRSEGFGRGPAEAMAAGRAVIATNYSGNLDFMTTENSLLVDYRLVPVRDGEYPFSSGQFWAEPDIGIAAQSMQILYRDRDVALAIGNRARADLAAAHSPTVIGQRYRARLQQLGCL